MTTKQIDDGNCDNDDDDGDGYGSGGRRLRDDGALSEDLLHLRRRPLPPTGLEQLLLLLLLSFLLLPCLVLSGPCLVLSRLVVSRLIYFFLFLFFWCRLYFSWRLIS